MTATPWEARSSIDSLFRLPLAHRIDDLLCDAERISAKTRSLFADRHVISVARFELTPDAFAEWLTQATATQRAIYKIDVYYERSAKIQVDTETPLWSNVERSLTSQATSSPEILPAFRDLQQYAEVERRLHAFDLIDAREFERILSLKCADVRIARSSIWSYARDKDRTKEIAFWNLYDQCWELIEDLQDLDEDGKDWNFNFWLYSFMAGDVASVGIDTVELLLKRKVATLHDTFNRLPSDCWRRYQGYLNRTLRGADAVGSQRCRVHTTIAEGNITPFAEQSGEAINDGDGNDFRRVECD